MNRISTQKFVIWVIYLLTMIFLVIEYYSVLRQNIYLESRIYWMSVLGVVLLIFCILSWVKLTKSKLSLYVFVITFSFLFTYGQPLLWAFGIHDEKEIGVARLYYGMSNVTSQELVITQIITLMGLITFHMGVVSFYKTRFRQKKENDKVDELTDTIQTKILFKICTIICVLSTIATYYLSVRSLVITNVYGYGTEVGLMYSDSGIIGTIALMYFPSIVGMLLSGNHKQSIVNISYLNFGIYTILSILGGNRGEWIFPIIILLWLHNNYKSRISIKTVFVLIIGAVAVLYLSIAIRDIRKVGITVSSLADGISQLTNPIISALIELGGTMKPTVVALRMGPGAYPFGNTYLLALLGMVVVSWINIFIPNYQTLGGWFAHTVLGYVAGAGAGFSFIAEAVINYGAMLSMIPLFIYGAIASYFMRVDSEDFVTEPCLTKYYKICTVYCILQGIRNTSLHELRTWFYSVFIMYFLCVVLTRITKKT